MPENPKRFFNNPVGGKWFSWEDVDISFRRKIKGTKQNTELLEIKDKGGIYVMSWGRPRNTHPTAQKVKYIGETNKFGRRMNDFARSAGFRGERKYGHGPAYNRWPKGHKSKLWVAFFEIQHDDEQAAECQRLWLENYAIDWYQEIYGEIPEINQNDD